MAERSRDWINQARRDIKIAARLAEDRSFEWACFVSQQAAEKAVKGVLQKLNATAWGHSVHQLLQVLSQRKPVEAELLGCAARLDRYYVPTRYPDSFGSGSPYEYFAEADAEDAILCGRRVIEFCESLLAQAG
jgi:HEPN domain-containing protein